MNISIDENIAKVHATMNELRAELLRLEGTLRTLQNMKDMGVTVIDIKQEGVLESKEVVENVQGGQ